MLTANQRLGVRAHEGVVRLSGDVDSDAARRIVESDVRGIPGVVDTVDDLAVVPCTRTDRQLAGEAERMVRNDPWLDDARVGLSASAGVVTLDGVVRSAAERARAEADARTTSPVDVDVTKLRIDAWNDDGTLRGRPPVRRSDGDLVQALAGAYVRDPRVRPVIPTIDVHEGVVVLTGVAANAEAARAAGDDARNLPGAVEVRDHLKPVLAVVESDRAVWKDVREAIDRDPRLGPRRLEVDVVGGRVYLRGHVASEADRWHAVAVTTSVLGARDVSNRLVVDPPRLAVVQP
jgi:osmotically-inducible protein OsmY